MAGLKTNRAQRSGRPPWAFAVLALALGFLAGCGPPAPDVPYVPTPRPVVSAMLQLSGAGPGDVLYDLGSGDGRIVIAAVRDFDVDRAVGIEIDSALVAEARAKSLEAGVAHRARFIEGDLFKTDFGDASIVTLYLLPGLNEKLRARLLRDLAPGSRVVSHEFDMDGWAPDAVRRVRDTPVYLWIIPADVGGTWQGMAGGRPLSLTLRQEYQKLRGTLAGLDGEAVIESGELTGRSLRFTAGRPTAEKGARTLHFEGELTGGRIQGTLALDGRSIPVRLSRPEE